MEEGARGDEGTGFSAQETTLIRKPSIHPRHETSPSTYTGYRKAEPAHSSATNSTGRIPRLPRRRDFRIPPTLNPIPQPPHQQRPPPPPATRPPAPPAAP